MHRKAWSSGWGSTALSGGVKLQTHSSDTDMFGCRINCFKKLQSHKQSHRMV